MSNSWFYFFQCFSYLGKGPRPSFYAGGEWWLNLEILTTKITQLTSTLSLPITHYIACPGTTWSLSVYSYFSLKFSLPGFRNRNDLQNSSLSDQAVTNSQTINECCKHISLRKSGPELHLFKSWGKNFVFQEKWIENNALRELKTNFVKNWFKQL